MLPSFGCSGRLFAPRVIRILPNVDALLVNQYVVALSANTDSVDVAKTFDVGMNFFYPKPIKVPDLLRQLEGKYMDDDVVAAHSPVPKDA